MRSAATDVWDVLVVGAGVAGLACAAELAKRGRRVAILDGASADSGSQKVCHCSERWSSYVTALTDVRYILQKFVTACTNSRGRGKVNGEAPRYEWRYDQSLCIKRRPSSRNPPPSRLSDSHHRPCPRGIDAASH